MISILHITDPHFCFCTTELIDSVCWKIIEKDPNLVILTGDLAEAKSFEYYLNVFKKFIPNIPVFFILGNHDYYDGSITNIRTNILPKYKYPENKKPYQIENGIWYLGNSGFVPVTDECVLIGHDGWYDGLYANWFHPEVVEMHDYHCITELRSELYYRSNLHKKLQELAQESARYIQNELTEAFNAGYNKAYVTTHVPPFPQNATYQGKVSDFRWLPNFSSKIMGDMLTDVMKQYPNKSCVILCGHSHGKAHYLPLPNLECITGNATYGKIILGKIFEEI